MSLGYRKGKYRKCHSINNFAIGQENANLYFGGMTS